MVLIFDLLFIFISHQGKETKNKQTKQNKSRHGLFT